MFKTPNLLQQRKVRHITRAYLENIDMFCNHVNISRVHDLTHCDLSEFSRDFRQIDQGFFPEALKGIGRGPWLKRPTT